MAPPAKRKFESDDDTPDFAGLRGTVRGDDGSRSIPTPETQTLYDDLRMIEDGLDMADRLQLQNGRDHAPYLQPPPHSPAPPSPRSPSCASTTHSLTRAFDDVAIEEEEPQNKRRKAMRRGPLDNVKRARAALMRKLGACAECKARRVGCNHFDRSLFEQAYQRRRQRELGASVNPPSRGVSAPVLQPSFNDPAVDGIGGWDTRDLPLLYPPGSGQPDAAQVEIENLLLGFPRSPTVPEAPVYLPASRPFPFINPLTPGLLSPRPMPPSADIIQLPIGRNVRDDEWECKHGDHSLGQIEVCGRRFYTPSDLRQHFEVAHVPYSAELDMFKCTMRRFGADGVSRVCGALCDDNQASCLQCEGKQWELWRYALISTAPSLTSGPSVRVGSQDGSAMSGYGLPQNQHPNFGFGQGQSNRLDFEEFQGQHMGGSQAWSFTSCNEKPTKAFSETCFPLYLSPQGCQFGPKSRSLQSQYTVKGPCFIIFSALSLIVMDNWLTASFDNPEVVLDTVRNHVFWMSLVCVFIGLAGTWLLRHIWHRLDEDIRSSSDPLCFTRDVFGIPQQRDIEDAGSSRGEDERLAAESSCPVGWLR
ncbi:hypothetical protein B0T14DRAFT_491884 [Immersiella caudata]|uniref:Uncharacterized protein n=1 Tax=Immersiella caudata TaxID=314043 RepID=A0AA39XGV2_9PEZI|nr:hypothetical protein B0T14DRAFT_491884 [Immersiella caudata]